VRPGRAQPPQLRRTAGAPSSVRSDSLETSIGRRLAFKWSRGRASHADGNPAYSQSERRVVEIARHAAGGTWRRGSNLAGDRHVPASVRTSSPSGLKGHSHRRLSARFRRRRREGSSEYFPHRLQLQVESQKYLALGPTRRHMRRKSLAIDTVPSIRPSHSITL